MLQITILHVGNIKDSYLADAVCEYEKRLSAFCKIRNVEIKEEKLPEMPSAAEILQVLHKEGDRLLAALPQRSYKIALCVEGTELSSEAFAEKLSGAAVSGHSEITFIIGSSFGMDERVKRAADFRLSLSRMTFPHRLMRVILLEQIYRAMKILSGGKYHK